MPSADLQDRGRKSEFVDAIAGQNIPDADAVVGGGADEATAVARPR